MLLTKEMDIVELSEKFLQGTKIAIKKLVEETAARDGSLVVGAKDGSVKLVPAKKLLETVKEY